ncbi:MAG TPA: DUF427 domain-containing protein [Burkholderiales bacterium]|nr:DUF427 domain-containing protein [Burkholderiales bacterium]
MPPNPAPGFAKRPDHRIVVAREKHRVQVKVAGEVIADTTAALRMEEGTYPPMYYFPRSDVRMERLVRTEHRSYCPFKGNASYYSLSGGAENMVWSYEEPYDEMQAIRGLVAFYPEKVDSISVL